MHEAFDETAEFLKALAQPTRLRILELLRGGERCVCDIYPAIGEQQSNVSRHLQVLRRAGVVAPRREGVRVLYRLRDPRVQELLDQVEGLVRGGPTVRRRRGRRERVSP